MIIASAQCLALMVFEKITAQGWLNHNDSEASTLGILIFEPQNIIVNRIKKEILAI